MLRHEVDGNLLFPIGRAGLLARPPVIFPQRRQIARQISQALAVNPLVQVVQFEVVQDDDARLGLRQKPRPGKVTRVVAEIVDRHINLVERP